MSELNLDQIKDRLIAERENLLNKLKEKEKESSKKGAFYYTFDKAKYKRLEHEGVRFI